MKTPSFRLKSLATLAFGLLAAAVPARAKIQVLDYYRMGEADNKTSQTLDSVGQNPLKLGDSTAVSGEVGAAAGRVGSTKCLHFPGSGSFAYAGKPLTSATVNCGVEGWFRASTAQTACLVYNGMQGVDGFGIVQEGSQVIGQVGAVKFGYATLVPGPGFTWRWRSGAARRSCM
jgi:hypothetical protein